MSVSACLRPPSRFFLSVGTGSPAPHHDVPESARRPGPTRLAGKFVPTASFEVRHVSLVTHSHHRQDAELQPDPPPFRPPYHGICRVPARPGSAAPRRCSSPTK